MTEPSRATYEPLTQTREDGLWVGWVKILHQDEVAPAGTFPIIRKLLASAANVPNRYNLVVELFREAPREYPPMHVGATVAGINLDLAEATALRDAINLWIGTQTPEDKD